MSGYTHRGYSITEFKFPDIGIYLRPNLNGTALMAEFTPWSICIVYPSRRRRPHATDAIGIYVLSMSPCPQKSDMGKACFWWVHAKPVDYARTIKVR